MYLQRKLDSVLQEWKSTPKHKPLVIRGARQVGKTESILHFAEKAYSSVVRINFVEAPQYKTITISRVASSSPSPMSAWQKA